MAVPGHDNFFSRLAFSRPGFDQLMRDGEEVIGAAKNSWLLRDYIEPAAMRTVPLDSFESRSGGARIPAAAAQR